MSTDQERHAALTECRERHAALTELSEREAKLMLAYVIGVDADMYDRALAYITSPRGGAA